MIVLCVDVEPPDDLQALAETAGVSVGDSGYLEVSGANGANVDSSEPGILVAGCGSSPKNIRDSIAEANAAADKAVGLLNPILLEDEGAAASSQAGPNDDMRNQIEKLLFALVERP